MRYDKIDYLIVDEWINCQSPNELRLYYSAMDLNYLVADCPADAECANLDFGNTCCTSECTLDSRFTLKSSIPADTLSQFICEDTCCKGPPRCGDGFKAAGEQCDDGNNTSGDGCSKSCNLECGWKCPFEN